MKLIVGLGNPGSMYEYTRHNVGFRVIDAMAKRLGIKLKKIKFKGLYEKIKFRGEDIVLLKPHTYMNESGISVREARDFFKLEEKDIAIVYDDIDIAFPSIRVKGKGTSGSHNGMKSIIYHLASDSFPRFKLSIGKNEGPMDLKDFVLSGFTDSEEKLIEKEIDLTVDAIEDFIINGIDSAMNKFNGRPIE